MILTLQQLKDFRACDSVLELFEKQFGEQLEIADYTPDKQEWLMRSEWQQYLGWFWVRKLLPVWSAFGSDFRHLTFKCCLYKGIHFSCSNFRGSRFIRCDFRGTNFSACDLREATFDCCNLEGVNFKYSIFRNAHFLGSQLNNSNFQDSDLREVNFDHCNLDGCKFDGAYATHAPKGWVLVKGRLQQAISNFDIEHIPPLDPKIFFPS